ncbi:hypothetical protein C1646_759619 [Rhizophagus diaphanus]|nr:hypothetical protein C1646_759619 [Rhizophagus diaphanus] [Rhizophagus sp. MUCL 43196]
MLVKGVLDNVLVKLAGKSQIHGIKDLYTEEQPSKQNRALAHAENFQVHEDYNEGVVSKKPRNDSLHRSMDIQQTSTISKADDVFEIDLEDVLVNATSNDNAKVIPTNGGGKQKLSASEDPKKSKKRQAEEGFPVNTLPPNPRDRSPPPSYIKAGIIR